MRSRVPLEDGTGTRVLFDLMFLSLRGSINSLHNLERKNATYYDVEHTRSWRHNGNAHGVLNGGTISKKRFVPYVNIVIPVKVTRIFPPGSPIDFQWGFRRYLGHGWQARVQWWKLFPRYCPFVRVIHRSPVNYPHKGQWRGALMFSLSE